VIDKQQSRTFGAAFVLLQGLVTAVFPQASVAVVKKMIGKNFENASDLEAKPAYRRQLRAVGVGMVAAAGTDLLLQSDEETAEESTDIDSIGADEDTATDE
jgi:hypothetical protein